MIVYKKGNLLESEAEALVNTVNCVGVMGKGIAKMFKEECPLNYGVYKRFCDTYDVKVGTMLIVSDLVHDKEKLIINFPTKKHWNQSSKYSYIQAGLEDLSKNILDYGIKSVALPRLGCQNGGLDWDIVHKIILEKLKDVDCKIEIWEYE